MTFRNRQMDFKTFWRHEIVKQPRLCDEEATCRIVVGSLKAALQRAYEAGKDEVIAPIRDVPMPDFMQDVFFKEK